MKRLYLTLVLFCGCFAQTRPQPTPNEPDPLIVTHAGEPTLPNGKTQKEMIVKDDYKKNLADSAELARLAEELKSDLENGDKYVVSVKAMKNAEDIEKLAHNIKSRLKRY
ncbi:MAG TPA: hypothetical protein VMB85_24845 [Bryobacteraceae bacterium]|nr:hypothetical protein [Bryobacteraceae bacterium]